MTCALALIFASPAWAQMPDKMADNSDGTGYIGASLVYDSEYLGSADEDFSALPYLSFENIKGFDLFGTALTYRLIDTGTGEGFGKWSLRAGPRIAYQPGRDSDDSSNLAGFDDVDGSVPIGGFVRSTVGPVGLRLDAGQDIAGGHDGFTMDASIGTFYRVGNFAIQPSATVSWGDGKFNDSFFSVTPDQDLSSGLTTFNAGSGNYSYSANVVSWVEIDEKYALSLVASYRWFTADASDSPILNANDGSRNGIFTAVSLSRKFDTSQW